MEWITALIVWYAVFLFSSTCHEAAHAFVAYHGGDATAHAMGQRSLNPIPHMRREPIGMLAAPLVSFVLFQGHWMFGWASAPYNPYWAIRYPKRAAMMSLSGPATNLMLSLLGGLALKAMLMANWVAVKPWEEVARLPFIFAGGHPVAVVCASLLFLLFYLNLILAILNLMPVPPFDGAAIPGLFLSHENRLRYDRFGRQAGYLVMIPAWYLTDWILTALSGPIFHWLGVVIR